MDTSDAQVSLGSDGIIESHPTSALIIESTSASEKSTKVQSPTQSKISVSILFFFCYMKILQKKLFRYRLLQKLYMH